MDMLERQLDIATDLSRLKLYKLKMREGSVARLGDAMPAPSSSSSAPAPPSTTAAAGAALPSAMIASSTTSNVAVDRRPYSRDVIGKDMFKKETNLEPFLGLRVLADTGEVGKIETAFGMSGKFKVTFSAAGGTHVGHSGKLLLRFKRCVSRLARLPAHTSNTSEIGSHPFPSARTTRVTIITHRQPSGTRTTRPSGCIKTTTASCCLLSTLRELPQPPRAARPAAAAAAAVRLPLQRAAATATAR